MTDLNFPFGDITRNKPAPNIEPRFARIEIIESIALVHLEVQRWSGKLAGSNRHASDVFTLLELNEKLTPMDVLAGRACEASVRRRTREQFGPTLCPC